eukprot:scaffold2803_cov123-Isochrysis_galbana.AAC.1
MHRGLAAVLAEEFVERGPRIAAPDPPVPRLVRLGAMFGDRVLVLLDKVGVVLDVTREAKTAVSAAHQPPRAGQPGASQPRSRPARSTNGGALQHTLCTTPAPLFRAIPGAKVCRSADLE